MSETAHNGVSPAALSFRQWQVWTVLLFAGFSGYLSLSVHYLSKDQSRVDDLLRSVSTLDAAASVQRAGQAAWLVDLYLLLPQIEHFAGDAGRRIGDPLQQITNTLLRGEGSPDSQRQQLRRQLTALQQGLQNSGLQISRQLERSTHYFYISMGALALAAVALLLMGGRRGRSGVQQLLGDNLLFTNAPVALSLSDAQDRLLRVNQAFEQVTGFKQEELTGLPGRSLDSVQTDNAAMRESLAATGRWLGEYQMRCKDGSVVGDKVLRVAVGDNPHAPEGYLTMSMDPVISDDEKRLMLWQAHHDNLTKLPNANLLHERLARALIANQQESKRGAVISIDLDNFSNVNDSVGHAQADRVLTDAAYRVAMCARETDTVARMGGDRFVIVLHEIEEIADAERMARAAVQAVAAPFVTDERELFLSASAGVVIFPDDGAEQGELLQKADAARMGSKNRGGNRITFFEEQMNAMAARRLELETHLRRAIANNEFELYYQPVMDISDDTVYAAEALLRWHSAELGFVPPVEFIPVAEETGLIVDIGEWVVGAVQEQLQRWQQARVTDIRVSLNVSARQFHSEDSARGLLKVLAAGGTDRITVELTESALVNDAPGSDIFFNGIRELGVHVALDDFGTGFSSVGYLRDFEFDVLKIDKSFIDSICEVRDHGLVASIVAMGRILGMRVIAEGVEDEAQLLQLRQIGCDFVQGYFYARPLPLAEFEEFLQNRSQQQVAG